MLGPLGMLGGLAGVVGAVGLAQGGLPPLVEAGLLVTFNLLGTPRRTRAAGPLGRGKDPGVICFDEAANLPLVLPAAPTAARSPLTCPHEALLSILCLGRTRRSRHIPRFGGFDPRRPKRAECGRSLSIYFCDRIFNGCCEFRHHHVRHIRAEQREFPVRKRDLRRECSHKLVGGGLNANGQREGPPRRILVVRLRVAPQRHPGRVFSRHRDRRPLFRYACPQNRPVSQWFDLSVACFDMDGSGGAGLAHASRERGASGSFFAYGATAYYSGGGWITFA